MCHAEAFGGSVLGDTDYLSILAPETVYCASDIRLRHTMRVNCTRHTWYRGGGRGSGPPPPPPCIRP